MPVSVYTQGGRGKSTLGRSKVRSAAGDTNNRKVACQRPRRNLRRTKKPGDLRVRDRVRSLHVLKPVSSLHVGWLMKAQSQFKIMYTSATVRDVRTDGATDRCHLWRNSPSCSAGRRERVQSTQAHPLISIIISRGRG